MTAFRDGLATRDRCAGRLDRLALQPARGATARLPATARWRGRLSGLLIGTEIADATRYGTAASGAPIGAGALKELYASALAAPASRVAIVDAERASQHGLTKAAIHLWGAQFT